MYRILFFFFTVCFCTAVRTPFELHFRSDKWETAPEVKLVAAGGAGVLNGALRNKGFMLTYFMDNKGCNPAGIQVQ